MKKCVFLAAAILGIATVLFGCNEKKTTENEVNVSGNVEFNVNNETEPQSLDPTKIQGLPEHRLYLALFEGLVDYDPQTSKPLPGLAESWSRSGANNEILTYKLRQTTWSDGTPITAQTVVDSWLYYLAPETAAEYAYMPAAVIQGATEYNAGKAKADEVKIRAVDDYTFEITLVSAVPYAEDMMAHYSFAVLPMHTIKKFGQDWTKPENFVGNGPFVLETWKPQEIITVAKNEKYWNKDNVFVSRINFYPIENETTAFNKFTAGEIDWDTKVPLERLDEIKLLDSYNTAPQLSSYYYIFNVNDPILKDVRVRKAITQAIDRKQLVEKVRRGGEIAATAFVPPMADYTPAKGNGFDLEKAKALLAEAGYPNGQGFPKMTLIYNTQEAHKKIAEYVQQQLKTNLNIDIELENMEWATFLDKRHGNDFQISRAGWVGDYADASNFLELAMTNSGNNDGRYSNPEFDALLKKAAEMQAGPERQKVLQDAEEIMITQDQAFCPLYYYVSQNNIDLSKWEGWYVNTLDIHPYVGLKAKK